MIFVEFKSQTILRDGRIEWKRCRIRSKLVHPRRANNMNFGYWTEVMANAAAVERLVYSERELR